MEVTSHLLSTWISGENAGNFKSQLYFKQALCIVHLYSNLIIYEVRSENRVNILFSCLGLISKLTKTVFENKQTTE